MRVKLAAAIMFLATGAWVGFAGEPSPEFTKKPVATRANGKVKIEFAVSRETDVAVFVEDGKGGIVRHLVAGVLGKNPPKPLKPGLSQSVTWDGKADYGRPAGGGPFKVRVALGLGAKFDKVLAEEPLNVYGPKGGVKAVAAGPKGEIFVLHVVGADIPNWPAERMIALDREGKYLRTVMPWPAGLKKEQVEGFDVYELDGRPAPLLKSILSRSFYRGVTSRKTDMAVTRSGVILKLVGDLTAKQSVAIGAYSADGSCPWKSELGPSLFSGKAKYLTTASICVSSDDKYVYMCGLGGKGKKGGASAVLRVKLPERGPVATFFGSPTKAGNGKTQLSNSVTSLATDGKGNLYIADRGNNRVVVVSEKDGKFVGEFKVNLPQRVEVDGATGNVYLTRGNGGSLELVKYSGWKNAQELAVLALKRDGNSSFFRSITLDAGAKPPVVWVGGDKGSLLRITQSGGKFAASELCTTKYGDAAFVGIEVDHFRRDKEVYVRKNGGGQWFRYSERDDKFSTITCKGAGGSAGSCVVPGPKGHLYAPAWPYHLKRYDRTGKPLPFPGGTASYPAETKTSRGNTEKPKPAPNGLFVPVSMTYMTHTFGIRGDGQFFMFQSMYPRGRYPKKLIEFNPDGKRVSDTPIIWNVSDAAVGPKFDQQGNIYIAEQVKPKGRLYPPELEKHFGGKNKVGMRTTNTMYGSIIKFSPKGGTIDFPAKHGKLPYNGQPKLDPSLRKVEAIYAPRGSVKPTAVTGALWMKMGISHIELHYCNCESTRFDVDEFGRVWYPDLGRFRAVVLDTNGNEITHFGGYGNPENRGPESMTEALKKPDLAFSWLVGVGATDKYVYLPDSMNRRLLRAKQIYAAEETCPIR